MPELDQMVDEVRSRLLVLPPDLIEMVPGQAVYEDGREVMFGEVPQGMSAAGGPGCDQHPIDAPLVQSAHDLQPPAGILLRFGPAEQIAQLGKLCVNTRGQVRGI